MYRTDLLFSKYAIVMCFQNVLAAVTAKYDYRQCIHGYELVRAFSKNANPRDNERTRAAVININAELRFG